MRYSSIRSLSSSIKSCTTSPIKTLPIYSSFPRNMSTGIPSETAQLQAQNQQTAGGSTADDLGIENTNIKTATGVELSSQQKTIVGSVLDLFAGRPSLKKLSLWEDDATFADPLTQATGRKQYSAQWYGLPAVFSSIERLSFSVTSAGNPLTMDLRNRYTVKGIGAEQVIDSVVSIHTNAEGKITLVQDRWNDELPEGAIAKAFRNLNSVVVPAFVSVPKNEEEDAKKGN